MMKLFYTTVIMISIFIVMGCVSEENYIEESSPKKSEFICDSDYPFKCGNGCFACEESNHKLCCISEDDNWCCPKDDVCDYQNKDCISAINLDKQEELDKKNEEYYTSEQLSQEHEDIDLGQSFTRKFRWNYGEYEWYLSLEFYDILFDIYANRSRSRDFDLFASDPYDDELITSIANSLTELGMKYDLSKSEIPYLTVAFVQALEYTSDDLTTGFDEYPRYPYETLYENGGDCEDTAILTAALLQELGYGVVLIELPGHMAIGVKCSEDNPGYYYLDNGIRYCYLETTNINWEVGQLPDEYIDEKAILKQIYKRPVMDIDFNSDFSYNILHTYVNVSVTVTNLGSDAAENTKIYVALQTANTSRVWSDYESKSLQINPEDGYEYSVTNLHVPTGKTFRVYVRAYGNNVISDEVVSNWITWK